MNLLGKEPAVVFGAAGEVVKAVIPMLIIFGIIHWTSEQVAAVMLVVGTFISFFTVLLTRAQTTATPQVDALIKQAVESPAGTTVEQVKAATLGT